MSEEKRIAKFCGEALVHYEGKLVEEKKRFGVLAIADAFIENNARKVVDGDAIQMWSAISEQSGQYLQVEYAPGNPQAVFTVLSKELVPHPGQLYELWLIVENLKDEESDAERLEDLECYDGPYKLEIPASLFV